MTDRPLLHPASHGLWDLMPYRIREVLLVSSAYDAYILEEDGPLTERLFTEYSELNLSWAPRLTHAATPARAMELLSERNFDLLLATPRIAGSAVIELGHLVKTHHPNLPVVGLLFNEADLQQFPGGRTPDAIDRVFLWTGDARSLISVLKLIEDRRNVEHDTRRADVQVIIVVEDSVRYYSAFLGLLYTELMTQAASLIAEGVNLVHKLMRMRARPKVLLATNYEQAMADFEKYAGSLAAVITDVRFPRAGKVDPRAGLALVDNIRQRLPELPILIQSAERGGGDDGRVAGAVYVRKNSPKLLRSVRRFLLNRLGFGPFVFRMPDGSEVARATDVYEMERVLSTLPAESLEHHAASSDFSRWLLARSMFDLGRRLRDRDLASFDDMEQFRGFLLEFLRNARLLEQKGQLAEFSPREMLHDSAMIRLGTGSIGGKARGIAFINQALVESDLSADDRGLEIRVPKSVVIGTDIFDRFMSDSELTDLVLTLDDDREIISRFLAGRFPDEFRRDLRIAWEGLAGPVAVRSSSLLEDQQFRPFSGIYSTYMLPNNHGDDDARFAELCAAIKAVYASTYCANARSYMASTPYSVEEEKMGVVIQEMVGQRYGDRYYPHFAGVAMSRNHYPIGGQKADEGIALVALGLGHMVVTGGATLRFSPSAPGVLPQAYTPEKMLENSQRQFYALDLAQSRLDFLAPPESSLRLVELDIAEGDGTLAAVGSVYSAEDDVIRDNLGEPGPRVVSFNNILKWRAIPLADTLAELLRVVRYGMGCEVEIEFAVDMGDWGRRQPKGVEKREPSLHILQIRPLASQALQQDIDLDAVEQESLLCRTDRALGHGLNDDIRDIVYIKEGTVDGSVTTRVAQQVGEVNRRLLAEKRPYLLLGPGRWGSSDPHLGIPVQWAQISGVRAIAEMSFGDRQVEPSQGTHFFQNVTSLGIGYLTLTEIFHDGTPTNAYIDAAWLAQQPAHCETDYLRHVRLDEPLRVLLDGHRGRATILKPGAWLEDD